MTTPWDISGRTFMDAQAARWGEIADAFDADHPDCDPLRRLIQIARRRYHDADFGRAAVLDDPTSAMCLFVCGEMVALAKLNHWPLSPASQAEIARSLDDESVEEKLERLTKTVARLVATGRG